MMKVGYARVSTAEQRLNMQIDALKDAGCDKIYSEKVSGVKSDRNQFQRMMAELREQDEIIVWKLDRLGRSLKELVSLVEEFNKRKIVFRSLNDPIDTSSSQGKLIFNIFASLAQFEREVIRERTLAGLEAARARGRLGGRPKGLSVEAERIAIAAELLYRESDFSISEICKKLAISKPSLYKYLRHRNVKIGS